MKRKLSLLLAVVMILGSFSFVLAEEDSVEELAGEFLLGEDVIEGINGELELEDNFRRQDMVVMISRLMGAEDVAAEFPAEDLAFTDFSDPYYRPIVAWAVANELIEGHTDVRFGFNEDVTAQQYATVLLRALGYGEEVADDEGYEEALELAAELGLLGDYELDNESVITRGQMFVLTVRALATHVKDSEETLADELDVELPEPEELEVEEVYADNLKEIKVQLNKSVDEDSVLNLDNYETDAGDVDYVNYLEDENMAVLVMEEAMDEDEEYELTIDGVEDDETILDVTEEFVAVDNEIPEVDDVIGLGTKAVKVVMTEPIDEDEVDNKDFAIDGKTVYGKAEVMGRDVIVRLYDELDEGEYELTVKSLEDFAGFKSVASTHAFEVVEDNDAPEVVNVEAPALEKVIVTFSEDVDPDTVDRKTVHFVRSGDKIYADDYRALAGNKYLFEFPGDDGLPLYETTLYIEDVEDYSGNKMSLTEEAIKALVDETRPEVKEVSLNSARKVITVEFTKDIKIDDKDFEVKVLDEDDDKVAISDIKKTDDREIEIRLGKALDVDEEYTLKLEGVKDTNKYPNYMADYSEVIVVDELGKPTLETVIIDETGRNKDEVEYTINLFFDRAMNTTTLSNPENYLVQIDDENGPIKPLTEFDNDIDVVDRRGREVEIVIEVDRDDYADPVVYGIAGLDLEGANGKALSNYGRIKADEEVDENLTVTEAIATAHDTIKVEFNKSIKEAPEDAFTIDGIDGKYEIEDTEIDGKKVTITLDEDEDLLPSDTSKVSLTITTEVEPIKGDGLDDDIEDQTIIDEVGPELDEVSVTELTTTDGGVELTLTFDEDLATGTAIKNTAWVDLEVIRIDGAEEIENYTVTVSETNLVITVLEANGGLADSEYAITIENAKVIADVHGNLAVDVEDVRTDD